jgi:hypothetical protein
MVYFLRISKFPVDAYCTDGTAYELLYDKFFEDPIRERYRYMYCTELEDIDIKYDENNIF